MQHELKCPACNAVDEFSEGQLIDGLQTGCAHCGAELILSRVWDEFEDMYRWYLVLDEDEEETET